MKYVFLIGNAHQLVQVDIAIDHFKMKPSNITLLIQDNSKNTVLLKKLKGVKKYGEVISFSNWVLSDLLIFSKKSSNFMDLCISIKEKSNKLIFFASHYSDDSTLLLIKIVNPNKFYLMDEGTASFGVQAKRSTMQLLLKIKIFVKSILYRRILKLPRKLTYFTKFDFKINQNDNKEFYIVSKIDNQFNIDDNQFGFLGSSIVELNILTQKRYLKYLQIIVGQNKGKRLLYFCHRKESALKLNEISNLGFEIVRLDVPFEEFFNNQKTIPGILGSYFTTTVLINISQQFTRYPTLNIYVFPLATLNKERVIYGNIIEYIKFDVDCNFINI